MPRRARVLRRVTVGRVVAAMRATALLASTQMNPGSADLDALLALPSFWVLHAGNGSDVDTTLIGHDILLRSKHLMHKRDGDRPFADSRRHSLDVAAPRIADREDAGPISLEQIR